MPVSQRSIDIPNHWLVTGASGVLGHYLVAELVRRGLQVTALRGSHGVAVAGARELSVDIADAAKVESAVNTSGAEIVVHAAGLTNVDECERHPDLAQRAHVDGTRNVVAAANAANMRIVYISTDHLWDGTHPLVDEKASPYPINVYARTKLEGERIALEATTPALSIRTNFFGPGRPWRKSFSDWILDGLAEGGQLNMFSDAYFSPISLHHLSNYLIELVGLGQTGILNVAGGERLSKFDFAMALGKAAGLSTNSIRRASLAAYGLAAPRPRDMSLDTTLAAEILGHPMPNAAEGIETLFKTEYGLKRRIL